MRTVVAYVVLDDDIRLLLRVCDDGLSFNLCPLHFFYYAE